MCQGQNPLGDNVRGTILAKQDRILPLVGCKRQGQLSRIAARGDKAIAAVDHLIVAKPDCDWRIVITC